MLKNISRIIFLGCAFLALAACHGHHRPALVTSTPEPRPVSIEIEVFDPFSGFVWQDVAVRIVEADQEWSGCTCVNPKLNDWFFTDEFGTVFFDEFLLADADVGFMEDVQGAALLGPRNDEDEALVVLELDAVGFSPVFVEVLLSWDNPDVFVSVPF